MKNLVVHIMFATLFVSSAFVSAKSVVATTECDPKESCCEASKLLPGATGKGSCTDKLHASGTCAQEMKGGTCTASSCSAIDVQRSADPSAEQAELEFTPGECYPSLVNEALVNGAGEVAAMLKTGKIMTTKEFGDKLVTAAESRTTTYLKATVKDLYCCEQCVSVSTSTKRNIRVM